MVTIGSRVGAILKSDDKDVYFIGYGTYVGDELPIGIGGFGDLLVSINRKNPKIVLDNGDFVFGCECWWASEEEVKRRIKDMNIINVDIKKERSDSKIELEE
jgi:hypothetical protein